MFYTKELYNFLLSHMKINFDLAMKASAGDVAGTFNAVLRADELLKANPDADPVLHLITGRVGIDLKFFVSNFYAVRSY